MPARLAERILNLYLLPGMRSLTVAAVSMVVFSLSQSCHWSL